MPNVAVIRVSKEMLAELLFPWGTKVHKVREPWETFDPHYFEVIVEHHSLQEIPENGVMPYKECVHERIERRFQ